jgi:hypothetical protein
VGATRAGGGAGRAAATVSSGGDGKQLLAAWRARGSAEAVAELEDDAWRPGEAGAGLHQRGTTTSGGAAVQQRGSRGRRREGGARGCCEISKIPGTSM